VGILYTCVAGQTALIS